ELHKEWIPLEEVVGSALTRLESWLGKRVVDVRLPTDLPLVRMDGTLMQQVLVNLVENALKYAPAPTPIEVSARPEDTHLIIEVADRGLGLPPGAEQQVFEKFYRAQDAAHVPGTGLGLTIAQGIVMAHGGTVTASQREGGGAIIRIVLPMTEAPPHVPVEREE